MEFLRHLLLYIHFIGFAMLLGGFLAQYLTRRFEVSMLMRIGFPVMFVSGLLLAIPFPEGIDLNYLKLGFKLGIAVIIGAALGIATRRQKAGNPLSRELFGSIGVLVLLNAAIAVFWR